MHLQLLIVIALVVLSAVYLGYRMFGSLGGRTKTPPGCAGCSAVSSCAGLKQRPAAASSPDPACGTGDRPFVS